MTASRLSLITRRDRAVELAALASLLALAWVVYQPAAPRPFDYVDFPENVRVLLDHPGFAAGYQALAKTYADHGRWSPIIFASIAAQWSMFEWWTPGWQLTRFVLMAVVIVLAYVLLRRLRLSTIGSIAAASLLTFSPAAMYGWTRLSTAEPVALLFLVLGCHAALSRHSVFAKVMLAVNLLAVMWSKEIVTVAFAFPVLIAICIDENKRLHWPQWPLQRSLVTPLLVVLLLGSVPVLWTFLSAPEGAFASRYSLAGFSLQSLAGALLASWLPFAPVPARSVADVLLVTSAFLTTVLIGWRRALGAGLDRTHRRLLLLLALMVPLLGALAYAPWPFYLLVYAMPFSMAGSLLVGVAVSALLSTSGRGRIIAAASLTIVFTFGLAQAANDARRTRALHVLVAQSVRRIAAWENVDSVLVEVAANQYDGGNFGPRFVTYARMLELEWPDVRDVLCGDPWIASVGVQRLRLNLMCPDQAATPALVQRYWRFVWPDPRPRRDSVTVSFVGQPNQ